MNRQWIVWTAAALISGAALAPAESAPRPGTITFNAATDAIPVQDRRWRDDDDDDGDGRRYRGRRGSSERDVGPRQRFGYDNVVPNRGWQGRRRGDEDDDARPRRGRDTRPFVVRPDGPQRPQWQVIVPDRR
jgi:hypothetical protein